MFIIKSRRKRPLGLDEPLRHESHKRPVTRRDFLAQGFLSGAATVIMSGAMGSLLAPRRAGAQGVPLANDIRLMKQECGILPGAGKIPFICFDLAGGANIVGSNVLAGKEGGPFDFLSTQGYVKQGLPPDQLPTNPTFVNTAFGLPFHSDSAFLRGMLSVTTETTRARVNGCVIAARSENDTGNNPHNPMYWLARAAGVRGELLTLIGSQNSDSGGNSRAPATFMDPEYRPTKIDRRSDVVGLVDTGENILKLQDAVRSLESMVRVSRDVLDNPQLQTGVGEDADIKRRVRCSYVKTADTVATFGDPTSLDPLQDSFITSIFGRNFGGDREFEKTAAVMKLVIRGYAGAGTISMGGFDYHTGERATGEARDFRAGQCMGACLEYAALVGTPLMLYVFSDGSLSSNGRIDDSPGGRGKGEWTGDNQATAASFFLVFNPTGRPVLIGEGTSAAGRHQQLGYFSANGDVVNSSSPAANNVNLLVQTVALNYMALHGEVGIFENLPENALGRGAALESMIAFEPIV
jgi:hypothetical protein